MSRRGFYTVTLGCKLNQFDGAAIEGELARRGLRPETDPSRAAVVVVNTCTVTHRADADARKSIRRIRRSNPDCILLVTGCYAELDAAGIRALGGVDRVFGNRDKPQLPQILDELGVRAAGLVPRGLTRLAPAADRGCDEVTHLPNALHFGERSRAFLKVQDGCRLTCSYCIIPTVRGPSRSVPPTEVERAAIALYREGYREIVLTGVNTGDYGRDLEPRTELAGLLRRLLAVAGPNRIRLNSLEPLTLTDEIIALMADEDRLASHLQVPLQSGSSSVLRGMRRNYRLETYLERLTRLRSAVPDAGLGADVMVGFPGETEGHFDETCEFIEASPLNYLHVFAWSPRPGTDAADLADRVHPAVVRERSQRLRRLGESKSRRFRRSFVGGSLDAVALDETRLRAGSTSARGPMRALTGNFIEVQLPAGCVPAGQPVQVRIVQVDADDVVRAVPDGLPRWATAHRILPVGAKLRPPERGRSHSATIPRARSVSE